MTDTIFLEIDFLHLGIDNSDEVEEKSESLRSFCNKGRKLDESNWVKRAHFEIPGKKEK